MARVVKHASTHRFRSMGGTDPVDIQLPFARASVVPVTVTADIELELTPFTNDPDTFAWDPSDKPGLLIQRSGLYLAVAMAESPSSDQNDERTLSILQGILSSGPFGGDDFGALEWLLGAGQGTHSMNGVSATSGGKTILNTMGIQLMTVADPTDDDSIYRLALFLDHKGTDFQVSQAYLEVFRFGTDDLVVPPPPNLVP